MSFKDRLREAREAKGLKQIDLSAKCGLSKGAVSNYEAGISFPNIATLYKIFDILGVDPNYLFQDEIALKDKESILSFNDKILLKKYNNLNPEGQTKVDEYIDDLSGNPNYRKSVEKLNDEEGRRYTNITFDDNEEHIAALGGIKEDDDTVYTS